MLRIPPSPRVQDQGIEGMSYTRRQFLLSSSSLGVALLSRNVMAATKFVPPYLLDEYAPLSPAEIDAIAAAGWQEITPVQGSVPRELSGTYLRNGPNPLTEVRSRYHWFDGDGFLHAVKFAGGRCFYRGNLINTKKHVKDAEGRSPTPGIDSLSFRDLPGAVLSLLGGRAPVPNTSNTDVTYHGGRLFTGWMLGGNPYQLDLNDLSTIGMIDPQALPRTGSERKTGIGAHSRVCPVTGELIFFDFTPSWNPISKHSINVGIIDPNWTTLDLREVEITGPHLLHDLLITPNYIVVLDMPYELQVAGFKYNKRKPSRFGVMRRDGLPLLNPTTKRVEHVLWFDDASSFYAIHLVNAYEENGTIVIDGHRRNDLQMTYGGATDPNGVPKEFAAYLHRWTLNLNTGTIDGSGSGNSVDSIKECVEFPTIPLSRTGLKQRYSVHTLVEAHATFHFNGIAVLDHRTGSAEKYVLQAGYSMSQTGFIERGPNEEDGLLATYIHGPQGKCFAALFDVRSVRKGPVTILPLPNRVPLGFHSAWVRT